MPFFQFAIIHLRHGGESEKYWNQGYGYYRSENFFRDRAELKFQFLDKGDLTMLKIVSISSYAIEVI